MEETSGVDQPFYLNDAETVTTDHLRSSDMRSLGDNVKLLAVIEKLGCDLVSKSENAYKKIDEIHRESEVESVAVKNLINEFQMLADSQFIENRIYDEDTIDMPGEIPENATSDTGDNNKNSPDQKILPIIHECISNSLQFIDEKFDLPSSQIRQQNESDEEEDYVNEALAKAYESNPFNKIPLPSIIGSPEFFNQSLFNDGGNQATETNREYYSEPSEKLSDDNSEEGSEDSDEEEQNLFTTINNSIRNYPLSSSSMQKENTLQGKDEVGYLNNPQFLTEQKAEIERKAIQKKPVSLMNEFNDDGDDDDDDLFTVTSPKISTPIAKINDGAISTKEERVEKEPKIMKIAVNIPSQQASEQIKSVLNNSAQKESDDSSDESLFSDFKSKLSKILTNKPSNDKSDSKRVSKEIRSSSTSSTSSKDNAEKISAIQSQNNPSEKNLFNETSNDEEDDLFEVKNKPNLPNLTSGISDDDDDDDLFKAPSIKIRTPIAKIDGSNKATEEKRIDKESKIMKIAVNIPSTQTSEQIKSMLNNAARKESDDSSDDSLFSDFKSKSSKILAEQPINDKSDSKRVSKEIRSTPTSSTSSKNNADKTLLVQGQNNSSKRILFDETSNDEEDDLFEVKNKPIVLNPTKRNSDDDGDDDDDDLFKTSSSLIRTPITKKNDSSKSPKEEIVQEKVKIMHVPINIPTSQVSEQIKSVLSNAAQKESDDSSDDSLFSDFKSKLSKILTKKPSDSKRVSKEIRSPSISSTSSKDNAEKTLAIPSQKNSSEKNLFDETSNDEKDDIFEVKNSPIVSDPTSRIAKDDNVDDDDLFKTSVKIQPRCPRYSKLPSTTERKAEIEHKVLEKQPASLIDESTDDDDDDLFKASSLNIRTPIAKINDSNKATEEKRIDKESKIMNIAVNIPSTQTSEKIKSMLNSRVQVESDDSSDDSLFSDFKSKSSKILTNKPSNDKSDSKRVSKEIRSSSTSSTSSKDNAEKISAIQSQNNPSEKNLFNETSNDEEDDLFEVKNKPNLPNLTSGISDDDDDDDLFKAPSTKIQPRCPRYSKLPSTTERKVESKTN